MKSFLNYIVSRYYVHPGVSFSPQHHKGKFQNGFIQVFCLNNSGWVRGVPGFDSLVVMSVSLDTNSESGIRQRR